MSFYMRNYSSEEKFDISKFMDFQNDVYDVIDSPFLLQLSQLQTVDYYYVDEGYKDIDLIQFYNSDFRTKFPEGTRLNMFSIEDLNELFYKLSAQSNMGTQE